MTTPALRALTASTPSSTITVVAGSAAAGSVIRGSGLCDEVQIWPNDVSAISKLLRFWKLRRQNYDVAIIGTRLNAGYAFLLKHISGIPCVVGDSVRKAYYYTCWRPISNTEHRVDANLEICRLLRPMLANIRQTYMHIPDQSRFDADRFWRQNNLNGKRVVILHPGSEGGRASVKRPPVELCRALISELQGQRNTRVVVTLGPREASLGSELCNDGLSPILLKAGDLGMVASCVSRAAVVVAGDTSIGHIAAAVNTPVVALAGPTEIELTRPYTNMLRIVRSREQMACRPCYGTSLFGDCPFGRKCLTTILIADVLKAIKEVSPTGGNNND